jgi:transcription initiation factor TFIID TATA-box-binding protein
MKICNITATAKISEKPLDLNLISQNLWNSIYNPKRFNAIIYKMRAPKTTILIFKTGKIVIVGAITKEDANKSARKTARNVQKILKNKTKIFCQKFTIQNIVAYETLPFKSDLLAFFNSKRMFCIYEPELFSPAVKCYRNSKNSNLIGNLFFSGKIVYTGSNDYDTILDFSDLLHTVLKRFKL